MNGPKLTAAIAQGLFSFVRDFLNELSGSLGQVRSALAAMFWDSLGRPWPLQRPDQREYGLGLDA